jgi:lysophospholipase L1-like esterase
MNALDALMAALNRANIPILAYIAPVRSDVPTLGRLCASHGAKLLNLESLVPGQYRGRTNGDWTDFMHFQGKGHELLAEALLPELRQLLDARGGNHAVQ